MAFDTYIQIGTGVQPDPEGESTATFTPAMPGAIEIFSFSWGASNPTTVGTHGTGLAAGKVSVSSFNIMKKTDKASPVLFAACCTGQHFKTAKVICRKASGTAGKQSIFLQYDFSDVMVESVQWSGSSGGDDTPTESVSLAFGIVKISYFLQTTVDGKMTAGPVASWDLTKAVTS